MASPNVLREWCRVTCAGYTSVEFRDWTSSFRSGLAFCAIIHKHRPDLIDFSSLSKDNTYQNNKLAFEIAETKLGIPELLDAKEMVSTKEPDGLAVITYLFHFYFLFNRKSIASLANLKSSDAVIINHPAKSTLKHSKTLTHLESTGGDTKPRAPCHLCFKPVYLIQRRLVDGKIYHRTCFRCRQCQRSLIPGSYTKGSHSLTCSHHVKSHRDGSNKHEHSHDYLSLSGLAISSVPHYLTPQPAQDKLVCKIPPIQNKERDSSFGLCREAQKAASQERKEGSLEENEHNDQEVSNTGEDSGNILAAVPEGGGGPVQAQRRMVSSYGVPVPTARTKTAQRMSYSEDQGSSDKTNHSAPVATHLGNSPTKSSSKVKSNHPWLKIIHPGPWTQLPPAPPPLPPLRTKSVIQRKEVWYQTRTSAPNPFVEENKKEAPPQKQTDNVGETVHKSEVKDAEVSEAASIENVVSRQAGHTCAKDRELEVLTDSASPEEAASHSEEVTSSVDTLTETNVPPSPTEVCSENPTIPESCQDVPCQQSDHGFPLIKRKVQTDQCIPTEELQQQMGQVARYLEALEEKGVELERDIRVSSNNKDEEKLLLDWFSLVHERNVLVRRDTELVYLIKQQELEQRQEDVEYELRCLLNKPEGEWTEEDRRQETELLEELVKIIEQRNQIISSLDEEVQRERAEDTGWETLTKNKDFQKQELKELKKSKGKFKTTSVFKILNQKESKRGSTDKKS